MSIFTDIRTAWNNLINMDLIVGSNRDRIQGYATNYNYYRGNQRPQLAARPGQADDNISLNFTGLIVNRAVTMLMGKSPRMVLPDDASQEYIDNVWDANQGDILLHILATNGALYGTPYLKIIENGMAYKGQVYPRLVALDPYLMTVETRPEDKARVNRYIMRFVITDLDGRETARREITEIQDNGTWIVINERSNSATGGQWVEFSEPVVFPYEFPPILHWQNLPLTSSVYGKSDIEDVIALQDRVNFTASNISKIIRYHAHPKTWGRGAGKAEKQSWGADDMVLYQGDNAMIQNLEMQSDLTSSREYMLTLRQAMFDITQTVDMTSMADKIGSLTNFGLRVLFMDALAKLNTKHQLYGEAIEETNRRLNIMRANLDDGGMVEWDDPLPVNEAETAAADKFELDNGLVSKETVSTRRGNDWAQEQERLQAEQAAGDSLGATLLRAFNQGTTE